MEVNKRSYTPRVENLKRTVIEIPERLWLWIEDRCKTMKISKRLKLDRWIKDGIKQELEFPKIMADLQTPLSELHKKYNDEYWNERLG